MQKVGSDTFTVSGNNVHSGGTIVSNGTLAAAPQPAGLSNPFGSGPVTLSGGVLALQGQYTQTITPGLSGKFYNSAVGGVPNANDFVSVASLNAKYGSLTPTVSATSAAGGSAGFDFANQLPTIPFGAGSYKFDLAAATFQTNTGNAGFGSGAFNFAAVWTGQFNAPSADTYSFNVGNSTNGAASGAVMFIDPTNTGNYIPIASYFSEGSTFPGFAEIPLTTGLHNVVVGFYQNTGSAGYGVSIEALEGKIQAQYDPNVIGNTIYPGGTNLYFRPDNNAVNSSSLSQMGFLTATPTGTLAASQAYGNNVVLSADSTINVTGSLAATLGPLSMSAHTLNLASGDATSSPYSLTFGATAVTGTATFNVANSSGGGAGTLQLGPVSGAGAAVVKNGPGTVVLTSAGTYTGGTTINNGTVVAGLSPVGGPAGNQLGTGIVTLAGGKLALQGQQTVIPGLLGSYYLTTTTAAPQSVIPAGTIPIAQGARFAVHELQLRQFQFDARHHEHVRQLRRHVRQRHRPARRDDAAADVLQLDQLQSRRHANPAGHVRLPVDQRRRLHPR